MGVLAAFCIAAGCAVERSAPEAVGAHAPGWARRGADGGVQTDDPEFHGTWLKANHFPLARCQACHGDDYAGGPVGVSCSQAGCHSPPNGPTECTTCHHDNATPPTPRPVTGAHQAHALFCDTCHKVPRGRQDVPTHASGDESTLLRFSGLAIEDNHSPAWDPVKRQCSNTYCHGALSPAWVDNPPQIQCDGCHGKPPDNHARWIRLTTTCDTCHPAPSDPLIPIPSTPTHVNGVVDLNATIGCTTCHGSDNHPNPPVSLDGSTDPTTRGVGAHLRHLDGTLPDRITAPLPCNDCHVVPSAILQPGHFDQPQTQVRFPFGGAYDATNATCNVWCHFNRTPGPTWTDSSGAARQCDACHDFPPRQTRAGDPHPSVAGQLSVCLGCHVFGPSTHVNGVVDFRTPETPAQ